MLWEGKWTSAIYIKSRSEARVIFVIFVSLWKLHNIFNQVIGILVII